MRYLRDFLKAASASKMLSPAKELHPPPPPELLTAGCPLSDCVPPVPPVPVEGAGV